MRICLTIVKPGVNNLLFATLKKTQPKSSNLIVRSEFCTNNCIIGTIIKQ